MTSSLTKSFGKCHLPNNTVIAINKTKEYPSYEDFIAEVSKQLSVTGNSSTFHLQTIAKTEEDIQWLVSETNYNECLQSNCDFNIILHNNNNELMFHMHSTSRKPMKHLMRRQNSLVMRSHSYALTLDANVTSDEQEFKNASTDEQLMIVKAQNERLQNLLAMAESTFYRSQDATVLSPADIETIRAIFESVDSNQNGKVDIHELQHLYALLGHNITNKEAQHLISSLDPTNSGEISFNTFLFFWHSQMKDGKKSDNYSKRFKFMSALDSLKCNEFQIAKCRIKKVGRRNTTEFRITFHYEQKNGRLKQISPWHDIPLRPNILLKQSSLKHSSSSNNPLVNINANLSKNVLLTRMCHFICEIPKWTRAKFEIATGENLNPIKQDTKNGQLRFYQHGDMMFNYGAFPQTWENPTHVPTDTGKPGDNDPLDVIEIGVKQLETGSITKVKVLGVLALLDSGETDWKILAINIDDPMANLLHDVHNVEELVPGAIHAIREYLRIYKVVTGQSENQYALKGEAMNVDYAMNVIEECHQQWQELRKENIHTV